MRELATVPSNEILDHLLHNPYSKGWHFGNGDPEFWRYGEALLRPNGRVLDIGAGIGRTSLFFAMHGMHVTALDNDASALSRLDELSMALQDTISGSVTGVEGDMYTDDFGTEQYNTVVMAQNLVHVPSKEMALGVLDKGWQSLRAGGHIWVRAGGKEDSSYEDLLWKNGKEHDEADVLEELCGCSGEARYDPILFFGQTDLLQYFVRKGARIVHSQLLPQENHANIMFGEDYNDGMYIERSGMVSVIAQKGQQGES